MAKIERVVRIRSLDAIDEAAELAAYRKGCLALLPEERIATMRALSRRIILLNPDNPRSPHIEKGIFRIIHDPFGAGAAERKGT